MPSARPNDPIANALPAEGRRRVAIEGVTPEIEAGRFAIKRVVGQRVEVEATVFADGHDAVGAALLYRHADEAEWTSAAMQPLGRDRWRGTFPLRNQGEYLYTLRGWVDRFVTWRRDFVKRLAVGQDLSIEIQVGSQLVRDAAGRAAGPDAVRLRDLADELHATAGKAALNLVESGELLALMSRYPDTALAAAYERELRVVVDRQRAAFSAWYELFPRSAATVAGGHGTLADVVTRLPYVKLMGFDVLYLPPIHPIGRAFRKGPNNANFAAAADVGSPWAIGGEAGGHTAIHPQLGTLGDFRKLVAAAAQQGLEIALDLALQCSPDHPYVHAHPEWFRARPDGSVQYAENPPKKYQDIYPFDFDCAAWRELWAELLKVVLFWVDEGVRIFRVDNPHTKPFLFWEWLIAEVKRRHPDVLFLAEAFTRPAVMRRLAKLGFTQSYTYFTWRNTKAELIDYFTELTATDLRETFRPNVWPNTPDILPEYLQAGGRPAFLARLVLAATLSANYGIYGPAFELCERTAREPGSEEYGDSEKYQLRHWDLARPDSLRDFIARINHIRRENPALQGDRSLRFHAIDNEQLIAYSKQTEDASNVVLVVANLDPHHRHTGWLELPLEELGLEPSRAYQVHDLLGDARFLWQGPRNFVALDPQSVPAHVFRIRRHVRTEHDFEYFL